MECSVGVSILEEISSLSHSVAFLYFFALITEEGRSAAVAMDRAEVWLRGATPRLRTRGGSREDQPHVQGVAAARVQEGQEELLHVQGQEE